MYEIFWEYTNRFEERTTGGNMYLHHYKYGILIFYVDLAKNSYRLRRRRAKKRNG